MNNVHDSDYVIVTIEKNTLTLELTDEGKEFVAESREEGGFSDFELFYELMEYNFCNGLTYANGDHVDGWLTSCDIIGEDVHYSDDGEVVLSGDVYTNIAWYQIRSNVEMMLSGDCVYTLAV